MIGFSFQENLRVGPNSEDKGGILGKKVVCTIYAKNTEKRLFGEFCPKLSVFVN